MVGCDLSQGGFLNIAHGIKHNRSLEVLNLSWNRVLNEKVADYICHMLQGCGLKEVRLRHCDIKDRLGHIIFHNIRKNKTLERIDVMNNLLGDQTAKTICNELKYAKTITAIALEENIVKHSDIHEINSYL
jgi:Ran GTPase-activating protein (RanGAP) involved in mRNA processing and transport